MPNAESGNGDRGGASQIEPEPMTAPLASRASDAKVESARDGASASEGDFERLKNILFGEERDTLDARIDKIDRAQRELPARLPAAIERAQQGAGAQRMADALAQPVTHALGAAVRENKQVIIDVLFPVIGPAIRKAIAEALRTLVADMNTAIESSFTPQGLRWRIEAIRSGVPYAQVVLKHRLNYGIDHVFLIERDSGLVLDRESAPDLPELDADAIAGMLTAIGSFVRDSVGRDGGDTLDSARVGEHLLWVLQGPRANLACFMRGVPPASLHALLEQRLEAIHAKLDEGEDAIRADADWRKTLEPQTLMREARAGDSATAKKPARWPLVLILLVVLGLMGWWFVRHEQHVGAVETLRTQLNAHPGFVLSDIDRKDGKLIVHGLLDPDAEPIDTTSQAADGTPVAVDALGYVSTDDAIIARRARRLLDAPASVTIAASNGRLSLGGHASQAWVASARERASWVPGVRAVAFSVTADADEAALARQQLQAIAESVSSRRVVFVRDTDLAPGADAVLDALTAEMRRAESFARIGGVAIEWTTFGTNDDPGSDSTNAHVRDARARWLAEALAARGIAGVQAASDDDANAREIHERAAFARLVIKDAAR